MSRCVRGQRSAVRAAAGFAPASAFVVAFILTGLAGTARAPAQEQAPPDASPGVSLPITEEGILIDRGPATLSETTSTTTGTLELLRSLEARHGKSETLRGTFEQKKVSEIFLEEIYSKGEFWFHKPDRFRVDYAAPDEMTNLIVGNEIYLYMPEFEQVEVYRFNSDRERDQQLHTMVLAFGFKTEEIVMEYEIHSSVDEEALSNELRSGGLDPGEIALLHFIPREGLLQSSPFTNLKVWIDKETLLPHRVWFEDYNGDKTTISVLEMEPDADMDDSIFEAKFPGEPVFIRKYSL